MALLDATHGTKINWEVVNSIRYADDTVLIADTDVQHIINRVNNTDTKLIFRELRQC